VFVAMSTVDTLNATIAQLRLERRVFRRRVDRNALLDRAPARRALRRGASVHLATTPILGLIVVMLLFGALGDLWALRSISILFALTVGMLTAHACLFLFHFFESAGRIRERLPRRTQWSLLVAPALALAAAHAVPAMGEVFDAAFSPVWRGGGLIFVTGVQLGLAALLLLVWRTPGAPRAARAPARS
jgi:hypothetical protein